jgi:hypothetical protein
MRKRKENVHKNLGTHELRQITHPHGFDPSKVDGEI